MVRFDNGNFGLTCEKLTLDHVSVSFFISTQLHTDNIQQSKVQVLPICQQTTQNRTHFYNTISSENELISQLSFKTNLHSFEKICRGAPSQLEHVWLTFYLCVQIIGKPDFKEIPKITCNDSVAPYHFTRACMSECGNSQM